MEHQVRRMTVVKQGNLAIDHADYEEDNFRSVVADSIEDALMSGKKLTYQIQIQGSTHDLHYSFADAQEEYPLDKNDLLFKMMSLDGEELLKAAKDLKEIMAKNVHDYADYIYESHHEL